MTLEFEISQDALLPMELVEEMVRSMQQYARHVQKGQFGCGSGGLK